MSDFDYEIAIIGLGPAGASLARLLSSSHRVVAIDAKTPYVCRDSSYSKPCGGLLSPDAQKALAKFDITLPKSVLVDPQIFSVKVVDVKHSTIRHYQRCYINMNRDNFDRWLIELIPSSVKIMSDARCTRIERLEGEGFKLCVSERLDASSRREVRTITAKHIVGADGAFSVVRNALYPSKRIRSYTSIQQWFKENNPNPFYSCIFDPKATDCCSWSISKDDTFIFGGAYPRQNARKLFEEQKLRLEKMGYVFGEPLKTEACEVLRPRSMRDFCCGYDGAFLIGEAAGFISASSLEGISSAFESARILSNVLNESSRCSGAKLSKQYKRRTRMLRLKLFMKVLKSPFMYKSAIRHLIMSSKIGTISMHSQQ